MRDAQCALPGLVHISYTTQLKVEWKHRTISTTSGSHSEYSEVARLVEDDSSAKIPISLVSPRDSSSFQRLVIKVARLRRVNTLGQVRLVKALLISLNEHT